MRIYFIVAGVFVLMLGLYLAYPNASLQDDTQMRILYLSLLLLLVGGGFTLGHTSRSANMRNAALWTVMIVGLALAYNLLAKISG